MQPLIASSVILFESGDFMNSIQSPTRNSRTEHFARLPCPKCQSLMDQARVIPGLGEFSHRVFACGACGHALIAERSSS
jgi:hypothetical protein